MDDSARRTRVEWREWGRDAFEAAERAGKPVLLSLSATWCDWCHEMDERTYSEPRIAANLNDGFVPVRVDVDRQPRVRERYNMGGFPSTVFATPSGEVLTGAGFLGPDGMRQVLDGVREMWDAKGESAGSVPRALRDDPTPAGEVTAAVEERMAGQLDEAFDAEYGGWGTDAKFPMPRTVEFALKRNREQAVRTLEAINRHLVDEYDGGFFRYAETRTWGESHTEKMLDTNAALIRAFANGYLHTGDDQYRETAADAIDYLTATLWTGAGFGASQAPGEDGYYAAEPSDRESMADPPVDETVFAGHDALAADALLTYHAYTDDERAARYAERALAAVDDLREGDALVHYREGDETGERGLLADHARAVRAFATAAQVLGGGDHLSTARALADFVLDERRSNGSLRDGPADGPGLLDRPLYPVDDAVELADALVDLAVLADDPGYRAAARDVVAAFAGASDRLGPQVAGYGAVASRLVRPPLVVAVAAPAGSDLHRAALRVSDHEKVVVPDADGDDYEDGRAHVVRDGEVVGTAATPRALSDLVASTADR